MADPNNGNLNFTGNPQPPAANKPKSRAGLDYTAVPNSPKYFTYDTPRTSARPGHTTNQTTFQPTPSGVPNQTDDEPATPKSNPAKQFLAAAREIVQKIGKSPWLAVGAGTAVAGLGNAFDFLPHGLIAGPAGIIAAFAGGYFLAKEVQSYFPDPIPEDPEQAKAVKLANQQRKYGGKIIRDAIVVSALVIGTPFVVQMGLDHGWYSPTSNAVRLSENIIHQTGGPKNYKFMAPSMATENNIFKVGATIEYTGKERAPLYRTGAMAQNFTEGQAARFATSGQQFCEKFADDHIIQIGQAGSKHVIDFFTPNDGKWQVVSKGHACDSVPLQPDWMKKLPKPGQPGGMY